MTLSGIVKPMVLLAVVALVGCAGADTASMPPPSPTSLGSSSASTAKASNERPSQPSDPRLTNEGVLLEPCVVDASLTGEEVTGAMRGKVRSQNRHLGDEDRGVAIEWFYSWTVEGVEHSFHFALFDVDGDGPNPVSILISQEAPEFAGSGWQEVRDAGTAHVSPDGSLASFDVTTTAGVGPFYGLKGTIECPAIP